jgi:hypothetical protein
MDMEAIRDYCLSLAATTADIQWGDDLLSRVGKKIYAGIELNGHQVHQSHEARSRSTCFDGSTPRQCSRRSSAVLQAGKIQASAPQCSCWRGSYGRLPRGYNCPVAVRAAGVSGGIQPALVVQQGEANCESLNRGEEVGKELDHSVLLSFATRDRAIRDSPPTSNISMTIVWNRVVG